MSENMNERMRNFTVICNNEIINCHAEIPSNECIFLWLGQDSTDTMSYGRLKYKSVIYGNPTPLCAIQINEFASRVAKLFNGRQVFVSTDIDREKEKDFWLTLYTVFKEYVLQNRGFFRLEDDEKSNKQQHIV